MYVYRARKVQLEMRLVPSATSRQPPIFFFSFSTSSPFSARPPTTGVRLKRDLNEDLLTGTIRARMGECERVARYTTSFLSFRSRHSPSLFHAFPSPNYSSLSFAFPLVRTFTSVIYIAQFPATCLDSDAIYSEIKTRDRLTGVVFYNFYLFPYVQTGKFNYLPTLKL